MAEQQKTTEDPDFMLSLSRGLDVLRAFGAAKKPLSNAELCRATGLARATVRRCLHTLRMLGYVAEERGLFHVTAQAMALGAAFLESTPFVAAAQPILDRMRDELKESSSLGVMAGNEILYLARAESTRIMSVALRVGSRLPAYCTSMGRVLLAEFSPDMLDAHLALPRTKFTEQTVTDARALRRVIAQAKKDGFALVDQELEPGLVSLAVPVRDASGVAIAAINVGAPASRLSAKDLLGHALPALNAASSQLQRTAGLSSAL